MKTRSMARVLAVAGSTAIVGAAACRSEYPGSTFDVPPGTKVPPAPGGEGGEAGDDTGGPAQPPEPARADLLATFTPEEVMNVVIVLNLGEVTQGEVARQQATNADVKAFAVRMIDEHNQALQRMQQVAGSSMSGTSSRARIADDVTANLLQHEQDVLTRDLKSQKDAMFDLAFMTAQISSHAKALALIDRALLPSLAPSSQSPAPRQGGAHHSHPSHAAAGEQVTGGAGGTEAAPDGRIGPDPAALHGELQVLRTSIAGHLAEALWLQKTLRREPAAEGAAIHAR